MAPPAGAAAAPVRPWLRGLRRKLVTWLSSWWRQHCRAHRQTPQLGLCASKHLPWFRPGIPFLVRGGCGHLASDTGYNWTSCGTVMDWMQLSYSTAIVYSQGCWREFLGCQPPELPAGTWASLP